MALIPLCANCLRNGRWTEMVKVQFALPELYPEAHFPHYPRRKELRNTLNWDARECPVCHYQSPLEGWYNWLHRKRLTRRQQNILNDKDGNTPAIVF